MRTASWNGGIIGSPSTASYRYFQTNNTVSNPAITETHVLTIRNKTNFQSKVNKIEVRIAAFGGGATNNSNESTNMRLRKDATVTGTTFTDIDADNSVMEVSTAGTFSAGTGQTKLIRPTQARGNGPSIEFIPKDVYEITLLPGETATITAVSNSGNSTVLGGVAWEERF